MKKYYIIIIICKMENEILSKLNEYKRVDFDSVNQSTDLYYEHLIKHVIEIIVDYKNFIDSNTKVINITINNFTITTNEFKECGMNLILMEDGHYSDFYKNIKMYVMFNDPVQTVLIMYNPFYKQPFKSIYKCNEKHPNPSNYFIIESIIINHLYNAILLNNVILHTTVNMIQSNQGRDILFIGMIISFTLSVFNNRNNFVYNVDYLPDYNFVISESSHYNYGIYFMSSNLYLFIEIQTASNDILSIKFVFNNNKFDIEHANIILYNKNINYTDVLNKAISKYSNEIITRKINVQNDLYLYIVDNFDEPDEDDVLSYNYDDTYNESESIYNYEGNYTYDMDYNDEENLD